jgi:hypothetical protein
LNNEEEEEEEEEEEPLTTGTLPSGLSQVSKTSIFRW